MEKPNKTTTEVTLAHDLEGDLSFCTALGDKLEDLQTISEAITKETLTSLHITAQVGIRTHTVILEKNDYAAILSALVTLEEKTSRALHAKLYLAKQKLVTIE